MTNFQDMLNAGEIERSKIVNFFVIASVRGLCGSLGMTRCLTTNLSKLPKLLLTKSWLC